MVPPSGDHAPSIRTAPKDWWLIKKTLFIYNMKNLWSNLAYKYLMRAFRRPFPTINLLVLPSSRLPTLARTLHTRINHAFASLPSPASHTTLSTLCANGLHDAFLAKSRLRPKNELWEWRCPKYHAVKVVSHRAGRMPVEMLGASAEGGDKGNAMRQVIFRIDSTQELRKYDVKTKGRVDPLTLASSTGEALKHRKPTYNTPDNQNQNQEKGALKEQVEKRVTEYLVIQRRMVQGVEDEWQVWGHARETLVEEIKAHELAGRALKAPVPGSVPGQAQGKVQQKGQPRGRMQMA
ncbi:hypothetical protein K402DRAFT_397172 [Aulographum hederae CBS 113979]|uniref:Uncharacterized protein n=1 Tax=Aulographum hederae CBS 113979 TaxID=1176131 RepID=A0A6G1GQ11_9PEZI|nr:hypothetical protein K402DRAFT_397172 [Aulographum hederae CBS 113979]